MHLWKEKALHSLSYKRIVCQKCRVSAVILIHDNANEFVSCVFFAGGYWVMSPGSESDLRRYSCEEVMIGKMLDE